MRTGEHLMSPAARDGAALRLAFTLIELTVVMAVVGILLALTMAGVGAAREAARKLECTNRQRQLILAVHQHEGAMKALPGDGIFERGGEQVYHNSGYWRLMPYFGYEQLAKKVERQGMWQVAGDSLDGFPQPTRVTLPYLLCPSDDLGEGTNYRFNGGSNPAVTPSPSLPTHLLPNGPFGGPHGVRLAAVGGGLSSTAALSERIKGALEGRYNHSSHIWSAGLYSYFEPWEIDHQLLESMAREQGTSAPPRWLRVAGRSWHVGGKHVFTPNPPYPAMTAVGLSTQTGGYSGAVAPTSRHFGGVNVTMLDGSVRMVADSVDLTVWRKLGSIKE
jgi:prepilin-type N-terminal cleavage/methylation domain-containing protein/prepilin-type processing-associated H-X9-DG protein